MAFFRSDKHYLVRDYDHLSISGTRKAPNGRVAKMKTQNIAYTDGPGHTRVGLAFINMTEKTFGVI